ncbi:MAG TPA: serine hydrolase [Flavipsychrobacter sp.]|nr:serine hydrolase [Flavipsychrobacter sp.]
MKRFLYLILLANLVISNAFAQEQTSNELITKAIDSLLYGKRGFIKDKSIIGANVGIYYSDKDYIQSYGLADREKQIKVDTATVFEIGSNTKVFTALLLSEDIVNNKVKEQSFIDQYVPVNPAIKNKIIITDLTTHTSGLPTLHDSESLAPLDKIDSLYPLDHVDNSYLLALLKNTDSLRGYGTYDYSNTAFGVLGYILTKTHHTTYEHLINTEILEPLQMHHTYCKIDTNNSHLTRPYNDGDRAPYIKLSGLASAGCIMSDMPDMLQFLKYQLGMHCSLDEAIKLTHKIRYTNNALMMGMGWHSTRMYQDTVYIMRGDTYGSSSLLFFDPNRQLAISIMLNTEKDESTQQYLAFLLRKIIGESPEYSKRFDKPVITLSDDVLNSYVGEYALFAGFHLIVTADNKSLFVQGTNQPKSKVDAVSENWFISKEVRAEFEFVKNNEGKVTKLILHQNGNDIEGVKLDK